MGPYMIPVLLGSNWKFFPSLDQEDTGITDVPTTYLTQPAKNGRVSPDKHYTSTDRLMFTQYRFSFLHR